MKRWKITWRGHEWTDEAARGAHSVALGELGFGDWRDTSPWHSPQTLMAWIAALVAVETGAHLEACVELVAKAPLTEILGSLDELQDDTTEGADGDAG